MAEQKTVAFFPEPGAWGPTNNCVAIGNVLLARGHRVVFVVDASFEGELEKRGFEERVFPTDPVADPDTGAEVLRYYKALWTELARG